MGVDGLPAAIDAGRDARARRHGPSRPHERDERLRIVTGDPRTSPPRSPPRSPAAGLTLVHLRRRGTDLLELYRRYVPEGIDGRAADTSRRGRRVPPGARRSERAPSGGWRTIAAKELADHLGSVRFIVLLLVVGVAAIVPMYFVSTDISTAAPQLAGQPALFLALFVVGSQSVGGVTTVVVRGAVRAARRASRSASTASTASAARARCPGCSPSRSTATTSSTASSRPGIAVIALMLGALVTLVTALGIVRLGIIPSAARSSPGWSRGSWRRSCTRRSGWRSRCCCRWSIRGAASAALVGFGTWLGLILFGAFLLPLVANALFPPNTAGHRQRLPRVHHGPAAVPADLARPRSTRTSSRRS